MKKFVAFLMVVSLGLFCMTGCGKETPKKTTTPATPAAGATDKKDNAPAGETPAPEKKDTTEKKDTK